jgi:hypothetical protein
MDRELVWNFVKICLLGLLSVLLTIRVWQSNAVEERLLDVQGAVKESKQSLSARANAVEERLADVQGAVKESKESLTARINAVEEATKQIKVVAATGPDRQLLLHGPGEKMSKVLDLWPEQFCTQ